MFITELPQNAEKFCREAGRSLSERDRDLLRRAVGTFYHNLIPFPISDLPALSVLRAIAPSPETYPGVWNWDSAFHAIALARWDAPLAREQLTFFFETQQEDGMFPDCINRDEGIVTAQTKPPILFWAYEELDRRAPVPEERKAVYEKLCANERFWCEKRSRGGLFFYSGCIDDPGGYAAKYESGWDTSPRFDGNITDRLWAIDLGCYMVLAYRALEYLAERIGNAEDVRRWKEKEAALTENINQKLYHEALGCYCDTFMENGQATGILTPASFLPLYIGIASQEQAEAMARLAASPEKFHPLFPVVSYDDPAYTENDYWRGPTWINCAATAVIGLKRYGFDALADGFRERLLSMLDREKRGLYEYYNSRTGVGLGAADYGWTASFLLILLLDWGK